MRRYLGIVNQMSKLSPNLAEVTKPLRDLLNKGNLWTWGEPQQKSFEATKDILTTSPVLAVFYPNRETVLSADASSHGLGAVLLQVQPGGVRKPVAYISRSMTPTEQRYAQMEKEALAFMWACERLADYLVGLTFHIETDHKPLVPLFSTKRLDKLPIRVQRFRLRMMRFTFTISHVPGKYLTAADALSTAPTNEPVEADLLLQKRAPSSQWSCSVCRQQSDDSRRSENITKRMSFVGYCRSGWPQKQAVAEVVRSYYTVSAEISLEDGLLMRGRRIIIP